MAFNKNELILDRVRSMSFSDLETGELLFRLTSIEDPTLNCTAESEEVTDALGSVITTLYRAKKATFSATNSLLSLDLAAAQFGSKKEVASTTAKITNYEYEILEANAGKIVLSKAAIADSVKYIYSLESGEVAKSFKQGTTANTTDFKIDEDNKTITLPTGNTTGKFYVEYKTEAENAVRVVNNASDFPSAAMVVIYAYFKDKCNENKVYSGKVICPKAKLNPESIELALTSTGKHAFELTMMKDYCDETNDELFEIVVAE